MSLSSRLIYDIQRLPGSSRNTYKKEPKDIINWKLTMTKGISMDENRLSVVIFTIPIAGYGFFGLEIIVICDASIELF